MLTKGKLLKRLSRDDELLALFQNAIQNQWLHAMWRYSESLIDAGELDKASVLEYERVIGKGDYAHYRAEKENFFIFITLLRLMKSDNSDAKAMELVFPVLEDAASSPEAKAIVHALCLSQDEQYDEAITMLKQVDIALTQNREAYKNAVVDEYRNTPLYLTAALLFQGTDLDTAREAYSEFIKRNNGNWKHIYDRSMRVVRDLEIKTKDKPQIQIITSQLLQSNIITNKEVKDQFSDGDIASIYDLHAGSLAWDGKPVEAAKLREFVMNYYYPHTLAGANCAMNWARFVSWYERDLKQAEDILLGILRDAPFPEIIPWVKLNLGTIAYKRDQKNEALQYVYEVLKLVDESARGTVVRCRQSALQLKDEILQINN